MSLEDIRNDRIKKLHLLQEKGINPYPAQSGRTTTIGELLASFDNAENTNHSVTVAGRVMAKREHGGTLFIDLYDGTGTIQGYIKIDVLGEERFDLLQKTADIGDFIDLTGTAAKTQRGEKSVLATSWQMLSKSLRTLPEKWVGLKDAEERYRKRYLDILLNPELKVIFEKKAQFWNAVRAFLKKKGFLEVETPTLEITTGGAEATPFKTHHNDFDIDVYLRISVGELWQKRLLAAGFPRVFEIGRVYRNEGSSPEHLQEYTNVEFYAAYMGFDEGIQFTQDLIQSVSTEVFGTTQFETRGFTFDLSDPWERLDYVSTVEKMTGVNVLTASDEDMATTLSRLGVEYEGQNRERLTDTLWKYCRKQIAGPAWLINHPKLVSPLSKAHPDNPLLTERVQLLLAGSEMTNGFAELNDPLDQQARFELQQKLIDAGDTEAMMPEWEFVEMLEYGMPPAFGFGTGERLFSFFVDKPIRETQLFPLMKPKDAEKKGEKKTKELQVAVAVINTQAGLERWQEMNIIAHLSAAYAARTGRDLFSRDTIETKDNQKIALNVGHAIMIKQTSSGNALKELVQNAREKKLMVSEFTREMLETTNDNKVAALTHEKTFDEVEHLGVLVYGPKPMVEELTHSFSLA